MKRWDNRSSTSATGNGILPQLRARLEDALFRDVSFRDLTIEHDFPKIGRRTMRLNAQRISGHDRSSHTMLLAIEDVTERKEAAEIQYRRLFESAKDGIIVIDGGSGQVIDVNPYFLELTRYPRQDIVGQAFWEIPPFRKAEEGRRLVPDTTENGSYAVRYCPGAGAGWPATDRRSDRQSLPGQGAIVHSGQRSRRN